MPSLPAALDAKYGDCDGATEAACIALQLKVHGRRRLPSVMILSDCDITEAGEEEPLSEGLRGVRELDLSKNKLNHWEEISKVLRHTPGLQFLNLSSNPLPPAPPCPLHLGALQRLVLNSTHLPFPDVLECLEQTPILDELHVCMNNYSGFETRKTSFPARKPSFPSLTRLHCNNNPVEDWDQVEELGRIFPRLQVLILAECPLRDLPQDPLNRAYREAFPNLKYLSLNGSAIRTWLAVYAINSFPRLEELRMQQCPLYEGYSDSERRALTIAAVWRIQRLNGGAAIGEREREDAERAFIRYHMDREEKPSRYYELVALHGELCPLVDVSLKPQRCVRVCVSVDDVTTHDVTVSVYACVTQLKKMLEPLVGVRANEMRLFNVTSSLPEEIKIGAKKLYTLNVQDGDKFSVIAK